MELFETSNCSELWNELDTRKEEICLRIVWTQTYFHHFQPYKPEILRCFDSCASQVSSLHVILPNTTGFPHTVFLVYSLLLRKYNFFHVYFPRLSNRLRLLCPRSMAALGRRPLAVVTHIPSCCSADYAVFLKPESNGFIPVVAYSLCTSCGSQEAD
jgi:hypothetical protein